MSNNSENLFFVIGSDTSANSSTGLKPYVRMMSRVEIIEAAAFQLSYANESLEDREGIKMVEDKYGDFVYEREMSLNQCLLASINVLNDDGRLFRSFRVNQSAASRFILESARYGLELKAHRLVNDLMIS